MDWIFAPTPTPAGGAGDAPDMVEDLMPVAFTAAVGVLVALILYNYAVSVGKAYAMFLVFYACTRTFEWYAGEHMHLAGIVRLVNTTAPLMRPL